MNERIKELAEQARESATTRHPVSNITLSVNSELFEQKFAELIVRECIDVGLEQKKWVEDQKVFDPRDENWNRARIQQSQRIVDKIKEHFGLEE